MRSKVLTRIKDHLNTSGLMIRRINPRPMIRQLIGKRDLVGAEIGVWKGDNSKSILKNLSIKNLFLIDPYVQYDQYYTDKVSWEMHSADLREIYKLAHSKLSIHKNITWKYMTSKEASSDILKDQLDFIYIDGNHSYEAVKEDIELYFDKVKEGGIIGGHDIEVPSVAKAVIEFAYLHDQEVHVLSPDWWFIKSGGKRGSNKREVKHGHIAARV